MKEKKSTVAERHLRALIDEARTAQGDIASATKAFQADLYGILKKGLDAFQADVDGVFQKALGDFRTDVDGVLQKALGDFRTDVDGVLQKALGDFRTDVDGVLQTAREVDLDKLMTGKAAEDQPYAALENELAAIAYEGNRDE